MKFNTIKTTGRSDFVNMGPIELRQPIPTQEIEMIDPFILLHHYGPYKIDEENVAYYAAYLLKGGYSSRGADVPKPKSGIVKNGRFESIGKAKFVPLKGKAERKTL